MNHSRIEMAAVSASKGVLVGKGLDCAIAVGMVGQTNPLGFWIKRYYQEHPVTQETLIVLTNQTASSLIRNGTPKEKAWSSALEAVAWFRDSLCPVCRGVEQLHVCDWCGGSGYKPMRGISKAAEAGVMLMREAMDAYDYSLRDKFE